MDLVEAQEARRSSTASTATRSARCCGRRSCPASPPAACSRWPPARGRPRARADGLPGRLPLGPRGHLRMTPGRPRSPGCSRPGCTRGRRPGRRRLGLRPRRAAEVGPERAGRTSTAPPPSRWSRRWPTRRTTSARSRPSPAAARRTPLPHHHPPAGGQPQARDERERDDVGRAAPLAENGFIITTCVPTPTLSGAAVGAARSQVRRALRREYLPDAPRTYASKVKNAQEAHEAIRPAGSSGTPAQTGLTGEQFRLYELIWMRTVARR